ncbi:N6-DNA-methyltransferase [Entamoeba marina]
MYPDISSLSKDTWLNVYKPDIDTYLLMDVLSNEKEFIQSRHPLTALEIGAGSGIVSAHINNLFPVVQTFSTDINPYAIDCIRKVHPNGNIIKTSLLSSIRDESVDLFVYNPPYVPTPQEELNHSYIALSWAGGIDGREKIDCVIEKIWDILSPNGVAYVILIQDNNPAEVMKNAVAHGLIPKVIDSCKLETEKLYVIRFIPSCTTE